eukprot:m.24826 g.24826  ORF g.24826 m.24826 type:complete len:314 (+) comp8781_c0_seq1:2821-3762(+)
MCNLLLLFSLVLLLDQGLGLSHSKLSVHAGPYISSDTTDFVRDGQPRVIKLFESFDTAAKLKQLAPGLVIIGRIYLTEQPEDGDPTARAQQWWAQVNSTILSSPGVDYWEGYNEPAAGPAQMPWYSAFEVARVSILAAHGLRAVVGCFSVGVPDVTTPSVVQAFYPALAAARAHGGVLGLHEYCQPYMACDFDNSTGLGWLTGRYRRLYNQFLTPASLAIPLVLTEVGIDSGSLRSLTQPTAGPASNGGWRDYMTPTQYISQLAWYDGLLRADAYVLGATVFLVDGTSDWDSFSVNGPAISLLAQYMRSVPPA